MDFWRPRGRRARRTKGLEEVGMSFLKRLLGKSEPPKPRIRICVECGMPVAEHKEWCSILRGQADMKLRATETPTQSS